MRFLILGKSGKRATVDDRDRFRASQYRWFLERRRNGTLYAKSKIDGRWTRLHRFILKLKRGVGLVDHRDRNGLNNRRTNLINSTHSKNIRNSGKHVGSSKYRGVWMEKGKWRAMLYIGVFDSEVAAARAYRKARKRAFP